MKKKWARGDRKIVQNETNIVTKGWEEISAVYHVRVLGSSFQTLLPPGSKMQPLVSLNESLHTISGMTNLMM